MTATEIRHKQYVVNSLRDAQNWADYIENDSVRAKIWRTIQSCIEEVNSAF